MRSDEERLSKMETCPCCGTTTSNGEKARAKYYDLLKDYARLAGEHADQRALIDASQKYLGNITMCVTSSARPNKIAYEKNVFDLQQAVHLLNAALKLEIEPF